MSEALLNHELSLDLIQYETRSPKIEIYFGDANQLIKDVEDQSIDLIATDPPYGINFEKHDWDRPDGLNWHRLALEFKRVLKPSGNLIVFQGWSHVAETKMILDNYFFAEKLDHLRPSKGSRCKNESSVYERGYIVVRID